jgi:hypothetical protein
MKSGNACVYFLLNSSYSLSSGFVRRLNEIYIKEAFLLKLKYTTADTHNRIQFYSSFCPFYLWAGFWRNPIQFFIHVHLLLLSNPLSCKIYIFNLFFPFSLLSCFCCLSVWESIKRIEIHKTYETWKWITLLQPFLNGEEQRV